MRKEFSFIIEKETKNTIRYKEELEENMPPAIKTIYFAKWFLGKEVPEKVKVIVEF